MASHLPVDFLSPSSSACIEICPALHTLQDRTRQLAWNESWKLQSGNEQLAQAVDTNTKAIGVNRKAVAEMVNLLWAKVIKWV